MKFTKLSGILRSTNTTQRPNLVFIGFGKLSESALQFQIQLSSLHKLSVSVDSDNLCNELSWIWNWTPEEEEFFMVNWSILSCVHGQVHSMGCDWLLIYEWGYFCTSCNLVLLQELYWVTACSIFVCQLDASWDPLANKNNCYYFTVFINKKKITCQQVYLIIPANFRVKAKERKKVDKYLNFACELKKSWNMKMTVIPIILGVLRTITKFFFKRLG